MLKGWPPAVAAAAIRRLRNSSFSLRSLSISDRASASAGLAVSELEPAAASLAIRRRALGCGHWAVPDSMAAHGDPPFVITKCIPTSGCAQEGNFLW
jgi:hypothetical protein